MAETDDDIRPLATGGQLDPVAVARVARKVLLILTPAVAGLVATVWVAIHAVAGDAEARVQKVDRGARAGYKLTVEGTAERDQRMVGLEHRLAAAELAVRRLEVAVRSGSRGTPRRPMPGPAPAPAPVLPPPKALPPDLDQAQRQVYRGTAVPATIRDAGP